MFFCGLPKNIRRHKCVRLNQSVYYFKSDESSLLCVNANIVKAISLWSLWCLLIRISSIHEIIRNDKNGVVYFECRVTQKNWSKTAKICKKYRQNVYFKCAHVEQLSCFHCAILLNILAFLGFAAVAISIYDNDSHQLTVIVEGNDLITANFAMDLLLVAFEQVNIS